jgi:predicted ArsR family transcriptional regulator
MSRRRTSAPDAAAARPVHDGPDSTVEPGAASQLALLKALGDNTRYAIYRELARSAQPLSTAELANSLQLHPNTVRAHLERLRAVGILQVATDKQTATGMQMAAGRKNAVGRPQHRYMLSPSARNFSLEAAPWRDLARGLLTAASSGGLGADDLRAAGAAQGIDDALRHVEALHDTDVPSTLEALRADQSRMGFDPGISTNGDATTVTFTSCPFRDLAESQPDLVCGLHCGMVEGFVGQLGGQRVTEFHPLTDRTPCRVELVTT